MFRLQRYIQVLLTQLLLDEIAGSSEMVESSGDCSDSSNTTQPAGPGTGAGPVTPQDVTDGQLGDIPPRKPE